MGVRRDRRGGLMEVKLLEDRFLWVRRDRRGGLMEVKVLEIRFSGVEVVEGEVR